MRTNPLVSVLMTAYNREKYLAEAIDSVLSSRYENFELIILDDCSKDNTLEIARYYASKDDRIRVYVNEKNLGDYPNRNKAASFAKGKYLKYLDADDLMYPYCLDSLVYFMEQCPEAGYGLMVDLHSSDGNARHPIQLTQHEAYKRHYFIQDIFHKSPLSAIINRVAFEKVGGFSGKRTVGDFEMWHILSRNFPMILIPTGSAWYRVHDEQEHNDYRSDLMLPFKYFLLSNEFMQHPDTPLNEEERRLIIKKNNMRMARLILYALRNDSYKKAKELFNATEFKKIDVVLKAFSI
jgi:glycosyltransferase involved in cell wall biosynthesis